MKIVQTRLDKTEIKAVGIAQYNDPGLQTKDTVSKFQSFVSNNLKTCIKV